MYRGQIYKGSPEDVAMWHSFVDLPPVSTEGIPFGPYTRTLREMTFDPWLTAGAQPETNQSVNEEGEVVIEDKEGDVHATSWRVTGQLGAGKSGLMKSMTLRLLGRQSKPNPDGSPGEMSAVIHDRRIINHRPEYAPLTEYLCGEVVELRSQSLNLFDPHLEMSDLDLVELAINICQFANEDRPLSSDQIRAIQIAVSKMNRQFSKIRGLKLLEDILYRLTTEDSDTYYQQDHDRFIKENESKLLEDERESLGLLYERPMHLPEFQLKEGGSEAAKLIGRLLRADYGQMFSGNGSLTEFLTRKGPVDLVWVGVPPRAVTLLQAWLWKIHTMATIDGISDLIPDITVGDEEHEAYDSLMYLRFLSSYIRKKRQDRTFDLRATQFLTDLTQVGEPDSERRILANNINKAIGGFFIGLLADDDDGNRTREMLSRRGVSEEDLNYLSHIPRGHWGLLMKNQPLRFFQHRLVGAERQLVFTEQAKQEMVQLVHQ